MELSKGWFEAFLGQEPFKKFFLRSIVYIVASSIFVSLLWNFLYDATYFWKSVLVGTVIGLVVSSACTWVGFVVFGLRRVYYQVRYQTEAKHNKLLSIGLVIILVGPAVHLGMKLAQHAVDLLGWEIRLQQFTYVDYSRSIVIGLLIFAFSFIFQEMRQAEAARRRFEEEKRQSEALALKAQVSALTAQMNPHLLFNALNSIAAMTQSNPEQAESMTLELSQLYRQVLEASKKERHTLADELSLCRSYLQIEKIRFGKRVDYVIEVQEDLDLAILQVPVLCLQPFLENALKHGIGPKVQGGRVNLILESRESYLQMVVKDDGMGFDALSPIRGSGTAIANCQARLQLLYGSLGKLEINSKPGLGTSVKLRIPLGDQKT